MNVREEMAEMLNEMTPPDADLEQLREAEATLEEIQRAHGPHELLKESLEKISRRIVELEITGEST